ncbi:MAG: hypothetical protein AB7D34_03030 [Sulfurimonas sp.]
MIEDIFKDEINIDNNFIHIKSSSEAKNQQQTNEAFSEKWTEYENTNEKDKFYIMQKEWYLKLYGFENENKLAKFYLQKNIYLMPVAVLAIRQSGLQIWLRIL